MILAMSGTTDPANPFADWLLNELEERGWDRETLAREAGLSRSSGINNVITRVKNLGPDLARAIAKGLGIKQRVVFVMARLIDDEGVDDAKAESDLAEIQAMLSKVSDPKERERIRRIIRAIVRESNR